MSNQPPAASSATAPILTVYATSHCPDCHQARLILDSEAVPYAWIDIDRQPEFVQRVMEINGGYRSVPTIVFADGQVLVEPSRQQLMTALTSRSTPATP